jgi:hypothetical protein
MKKLLVHLAFITAIVACFAWAANAWDDAQISGTITGPSTITKPFTAPNFTTGIHINAVIKGNGSAGAADTTATGVWLRDTTFVKLWCHTLADHNDSIATIMVDSDTGTTFTAFRADSLGLGAWSKYRWEKNLYFTITTRDSTFNHGSTGDTLVYLKPKPYFIKVTGF